MFFFWQGDFFETLLYKIFVSIDENTTVAEVSSNFSFQFHFLISILRRYSFLKKSFILFGLDVSCWHQSKKKSYKCFLWCRIRSSYKGFKGYKSLFYELLFCFFQLASILEIDSNHIRNAVSLYCRLGIAKKKNADLVKLKSQTVFIIETFYT